MGKKKRSLLVVLILTFCPKMSQQVESLFRGEGTRENESFLSAFICVYLWPVFPLFSIS